MSNGRVKHLTTFFETLSSSMDSANNSLSRSEKSNPDNSASKVKKTVRDLIEVRRPSNKNRTESYASGSCNITGSNSAISRGPAKNYGKYSRNSSSWKRRKSFVDKMTKPKMDHDSSLNKNLVTDRLQKYELLAKNKEGSKIKKSVSFKKEYKYHEATNGTVELKEQKLQTNYLNVTDENGNDDNLLKKYQKRDGPQQQRENIGEIIETNICDTLYDSAEDRRDENGESSDDMFGFNNFDEVEDDNYIIETYNREGEELIITTLQITRRTVTADETGDSLRSLIQDSYLVIQTDGDENIIDVNSEPDSFPTSNYHNEEFSSESDDCDEIKTKQKEIFTETDDNGYTSPSTFRGILHSSRDQGDNFFHNITPALDSEEVNASEETNSCETLNKNAEKKQKINYILEEIIKTEELYIGGLEKIVHDYMPFLMKETPHDLIGKTTYIFGNIESIYRNAKKFLVSLKESAQDADEIAQLFIDNVDMFELYPLYSKNKPTADKVLKEFDEFVKRRQTELKDKLGLASYLLTPIQRMGKYVLLLEQIQKELNKKQQSLEKIETAVSVIRGVMRKGNDYIAIDSIKQCEIDLRLQGSFIMRSLFNISKPRKFVSMVFLFENVIVFTEKLSKNTEEFKYVDNIQINDLSINIFEERPNVFHLTNFTKSKKGDPDATYVLEAESQKIKNDWTSEIEKKLWLQLENAKELQKKQSFSDHRHQKKQPSPYQAGTRSLDRKHPKLGRTKSRSTFYANSDV
nr:PREDICTED: uncharacterized protein LOC103313000 [Tribolium castaneum]|eukprot:XP_008193316.1 PREDICTED: uncharacterized protein LOC103313000 [Tribolium castaneum]